MTRFSALRPTHVQFGTLLLFGTFMALLAGRFTLSRLSDSLPSLDLRWLFVAALSVFTLWWVTITPIRFRPPVKMRGYVWFITWLGWMMLSTVWAPSDARIWTTGEDLVLLGFFVTLAWWLMASLPPESSMRVFTWLMFIGVIYFALSIAQGPQAQGRFSAPGGGPNVFARIMVLAALAALFYLIVRRKMLLAAICLPLFVLGAVLSGSRGALLGAGVALLLAFIPLVRRLGFWKFTLSVAALVAMGSFALNTSKIDVATFVEERYIEQTFEQGYSSGRDEITGDVWRIFTEHAAFGSGLDGYFPLQETPGKFEYPHNLLLAVAAEGGLVGAILLIGAWCVLFRLAIRKRPVPLVSLIAVASLLFLTVASFSSGDYYDSRYIWLFGALASVVTAKRPPGVIGARRKKRAPITPPTPVLPRR